MNIIKNSNNVGKRREKKYKYKFSFNLLSNCKKQVPIV